ncbi:hypothetical protein EMPS_07338 [Entomortierella parvispora]|uniref:F-box domain-containing protein n=1 Tax=Entomortierella parvispora TaxID=205924 RepID=A0A9P3LYL2_9FUNG|nr:hypothetical protein EMPS_07338 [Entomortierella parvispora]
MSVSMDLSDVPEILVMVSKYLQVKSLSRATRVSRQWHRFLLPELWSCLHIVGYKSRFGMTGPKFLRSLFRYGHFVRMFCTLDHLHLDLFRPHPGNHPRNDLCPLNKLTKLILPNFDSNDWETGPGLHTPM